MELFNFTPEDYERLYDFMSPIWYDTYGKIIPKEQISFLLDKYFSPSAISRQIREGYIYKKIDSVGVLVYQMRGADVYIDKLYLTPEARGCGYPEFVFGELSALGDLTLNVNRENKRAVACYKRCGFTVESEVEIPLGDGMVNCDYIMRKRMSPRTEPTELTVLCLIERDGKILFQKRERGDWLGYTPPGGHVEPGESIVAAARREVLEETGLTVNSETLVGIKQFPLKRGGRYLVFFFKINDFSGEAHGSEEGDVAWISREDIANHKTVPDFDMMLKVFDDPNITEFQYVVENGEWNVKLF